MYKGEKKTIFYVLGLYLSSTILLIATLFSGYYIYEKDQMLHDEKEILIKYAAELEKRLSVLHEANEQKLVYPRFGEFKSAIYDIDKNLLFSTLENNIQKFDKEFFTKGQKYYLISSLSPYYLGAAYSVIEKEAKEPDMLDNLIYIAAVTVVIAVITSYFLVNIVLRPMRQNIKLLDDFIKDTTHELNTPITAILTNIETIDSGGCTQKTLRKLQRIKIASQSISNLYQDLVYLLLNHQVSTQNIELDMSEILKQRVSYFLETASTKGVEFILDIKHGVTLFADRKKIERLIDNILSNALKYTKRSTNITVILRDSELTIQDEGKGMSKEELGRIFLRYVRFDKTQGGFGIGYDIIKSITDEYGIKIDIDSKPDKGTKVTLKW